MPREDPIAEEEQRARSAYDLIRMRLDRLEQNIHKPAPIPSRKEQLKAPKPPPDFVRNVVGSSAAAGSAEFHIFRNNRRKEMNRLDYIDKKAELENLEEEFKAKRDAIEKVEAEKTAKKRAKRQRRKEKLKRQKKNKGQSESESDSEEESEDDEKKEENDKEEKKTEEPKREDADEERITSEKSGNEKE